MNVLTRSLRTAWDEANKPLIYVKADEFENHVRATLFPCESFDILEKARDFSDNRENRAAFSVYPDIKFRSKISGFEFFVEAKFRARFQNQILEWSKFFELKNYQQLDNLTPVLIAVGLGGRPSMPERVFLMPVKHIKFVKLYPGFMQKYEVDPSRPVTESLIKRILE